MVRVASCSVRGLPDTYSDRRNARRRHLLGEIVESLREDAPVDALVLPGGYFVEGRPISRCTAHSDGMAQRGLRFEHRSWRALAGQMQRLADTPIPAHVDPRLTR